MRKRLIYYDCLCERNVKKSNSGLFKATKQTYALEERLSQDCLLGKKKYIYIYIYLKNRQGYFHGDKTVSH
jgi:hypothetical protein